MGSHDPSRSLSARVRAGEPAAIARLLTRVENDDAVGREALENLLPDTGRAHLIGVTGPPGGGKSTLVNELIRHFRAEDRRVAVIAVDPSSPFSGGAALGDRIRMLEWHDDPNVFIRSMASRSFGGGLARTTLGAVAVLDAAGFDPIIIETVGTGQDEVAIAQLAHTTLLVQVPGMGDSVQTLKAGSLEIGDIIVVTKADRPESNDLARDLRRMQSLIPPEPGARIWQPPVIKTSAVTGEGMADLISAIQFHRTWLSETGELDQRRRQTAVSQLAEHLRYELLKQAADPSRSGLFPMMVDEILAKAITPQRAATLLLALLEHARQP